MAKKSGKLNSTVLPIFFLALSVISAILFRGAKTNWVFINVTVGFEFFTVVMLILMVLSSILFAALSAAKIYKASFAEKKAYNTLLIIGIILGSILGLFALIYSIGFSMGENREVFVLNVKKTLSEGAPLILIPLLSVFLPALNKKTKKVIVSVLLVATLIFGINSFYPLTPFKITSTPLVIDNGSEYSIVFSTSDHSTGWVEYSFDGKDYKVVDQSGGRLNSDSKIHSINVPYEHLRNNSYKVGSTRLIEEFSYGSRTGKTVYSEDYEFTCNDSENQTWLVISDWHTYLDRAYSAIDNFSKDYDAVIMLGDSSPGVDFEEQVITNTVQFGGKISSGTKPVIYVRGNHETRGAYASKLSTALGIDRFYYTADVGHYSFVVLDSGEDKDDSHIEYGGMTDYNTYRADMIEWLKGVETKNDKVITLSHSWEISDVEPELSEAGFRELDRLGTRLLVSGHIHQCRFLGEGSEKETEVFTTYPDIIGYADGGKSGDSYIASMITLSNDGFEINAVDMNGNSVIDETFTW